MSRLRLPLVIAACCLFWVAFGAFFGIIFRHALVGLIFGLIFGLAYTTIGIFAAEKFPLAVWDAKLLESDTAPKLYEMLAEICEKADADLPTVFSCPSLTPNAFAVSRRDGGPAIILTSGLTRSLERDEVQAVLALMIARLATGDMAAWTVTATLAGLPLHLGLSCCRRAGLEWLGATVLSIFAYPCAGLARLGWNEGPITASDFHAAHLAEHPGSLEAALMEIEKGIAEDAVREGNPATAMLFAVPPIPVPLVGAALWRRALAAFPFRSPDAVTRAARVASGPEVPLGEAL